MLEINNWDSGKSLIPLKNNPSTLMISDELLKIIFKKIEPILSFSTPLIDICNCVSLNSANKINKNELRVFRKLKNITFHKSFYPSICRMCCLSILWLLYLLHNWNCMKITHPYVLKVLAEGLLFMNPKVWQFGQNLQ